MSIQYLIGTFACFTIAAALIPSSARIVLAIEDWVLRALELFRPGPLRLIPAEHGLVLSADGAPLDPSLAQSLRHEAGVSRRAAARHV